MEKHRCPHSSKQMAFISCCTYNLTSRIVWRALVWEHTSVCIWTISTILLHCSCYEDFLFQFAFSITFHTRCQCNNNFGHSTWNEIFYLILHVFFFFISFSYFSFVMFSNVTSITTPASHSFLSLDEYCFFYVSLLSSSLRLLFRMEKFLDLFTFDKPFNALSRFLCHSL